MQNQGIRDARSLGTPKMLVLGLQHMFAMFGATVLVPALTGLSVSATLLFAGLGTLFSTSSRRVRFRLFWAVRSRIWPVMPPSRRTARPRFSPMPAWASPLPACCI